MTESDNAPVEEAVPDAPTTESPTNPTPVPDAPGEQEAVSDSSQSNPDDAPELDAAPVSAVPDPDAVSDADVVNPNHDEDDDPEAHVGDEVEEG